jgi:hypothetical protein
MDKLILGPNVSHFKFIDISSEEYRTYHFDTGLTFTINNPLYLHVSDSGSHRILDEQGVSHYVSSILHLSWKVKSGQPSFVK